MVFWKRAIRAGLSLMFIGMGESVSAQTEITITNLLGKQALTDPLPIRVEFRQGSAPTRGVLEWWNEMNLRYRVPIELPAGAYKVVDLALPLNAWSQQGRAIPQQFRFPFLVWRSETGELRMLEVPWDWNKRLPVVVIGNLQGGFEKWRSASFAMDYRFAGQKVSKGDWTLEPIYWSPSSVPTNWNALAGIPVIILTEGSEQLSSEQWDALLAWLLAGGHLIVSVGSIGAPLKSTPLAPLLPPFSARKLLSIPPQQGQSAGSEAIPIIESQGWGDESRAIREGNALLACSRPVGRGTLTLCFGDMNALAWRNWQGYTRLINRWTAQMRLPLFGVRTAFERRSLRNPIERMQVLGATGVFALYWLALFVSWRILRRRRRLVRAPLVVMVLTALASLALVQIVPSTIDQQQNYWKRTLLTANGLPIALEHSHYHLLIPASEARLHWEPEMQVFAMRRQSLLGERVRVEYGAQTEVVLEPFGAMEVQMQMVRVLKLPAPLTIAQNNKQYTVRNSLPYPLRQVQIRRAGTGAMPAGIFELMSLVPASTTLSAEPRRVRQATELMPDEGEWLTASVEGLPSPVKSRLEGQEEATTLWVRIR